VIKELKCRAKWGLGTFLLTSLSIAHLGVRCEFYAFWGSRPEQNNSVLQVRVVSLMQEFHHVGESLLQVFPSKSLLALTRIEGDKQRMSWQVTEQGALFAISIIAFAYSGYQRGWKRETISLLFIVLGLVFLLMDGGVYLARLLYQLLLGVNLTNSELLASHQRFVIITSFFAVVIIVIIGYAIGRRFPKGAGADRTLGIIPGIITGALVAAYVTYFIFPSTQTAVISAGTVNTGLVPNLTANLTVVVIFIAALVAIVIGLAAVRPKKGGGGGGGHK
jgi:hypothetical protein